VRYKFDLIELSIVAAAMAISSKQERSRLNEYLVLDSCNRIS
jgi:hypothetical protein